MEFDQNKSLEELDGEQWGEPTHDSRLVTECHRLRRVPLRDFTVEDLRLLIGQEISLPLLIPVALEKLRENPLVSGDFYEGDLLRNVLMIEPNFWREHPQLAQKTSVIAARALDLLKEMNPLNRAAPDEA